MALQMKTIIAAVREESELDDAIKSPVDFVFLLNLNINSIQRIVEKVKNSGKTAFIHCDMVAGLSKDAYAVEYIVKHAKPDGIISTKHNLLRVAKKHNLLTVQRVFLIDSLSYESVKKILTAFEPDFLEVMPGVMPEVISLLSKKVKIPIIAGGMIKDTKAVTEALNSGACAISTSQKKLWWQ
jgi:glycerol uptake operon antiterminator